MGVHALELNRVAIPTGLPCLKLLLPWVCAADMHHRNALLMNLRVTWSD